MTSRITTPFSGQTTADEVVAGLDLAGQRIIVTGGASGIGVETARSLASAGADVTLAVRSVAGGEKAAAVIAESTGRPVLVAHLDLADTEPSARSRQPGTARCTCCSTTPA